MTIIEERRAGRFSYWVMRGNGKMALPFLTREGAEAFCRMMENAKMEDGETGEPCELIAAARAILDRIEGEGE